MSPLIAEHRGVEIRYGWSVHEDVYHAYFDLPAKPLNLNVMQSRVKRTYSPNWSVGKNRVTSQSESDLLRQARGAIDAYYDE
jgi:hypothetical protein